MLARGSPNTPLRCFEKNIRFNHPSRWVHNAQHPANGFAVVFFSFSRQGTVIRTETSTQPNSWKDAQNDGGGKGNSLEKHGSCWYLC